MPPEHRPVLAPRRALAARAGLAATAPEIDNAPEAPSASARAWSQPVWYWYEMSAFLS